MINAMFGLMVAKKPSTGRPAGRGNSKAKHPFGMHPIRILTMIGLIVVILCIALLAARSLNIGGTGSASTVPGDSVQPTTIPDQGYLTAGTSPTPSATTSPGSTAQPGGTATISVSITPTPIVTSTATASPTATPTPTPTVTPTPTPTATPTPTPTPIPTITPTPTPSIVADAPFFESITPIKDSDRGRVQNPTPDYQSGSGPLYLDFSNSYLGSPYAYPGDTFGMKLRLYNQGPALDTIATITLNVSKNMGSLIGYVPVISQQFNTHIVADANSAVFKNVSVPIPNTPGFEGLYSVRIGFYANGRTMSTATTYLTIL